MKTRNLLYTACLAAAFGTYACQQHTQTAAKPTDWNDYNVGTILFEDKSTRIGRFGHLSPHHSRCRIVHQGTGTYCISYSLQFSGR